MHRYTAFGLTLASSLPLPELQAGEGEEDVHISSVKSSETEFLLDPSDVEKPAGIWYRYASPNQALLIWDGVGELLVRDGNCIEFTPASGAEEDTLRLFILGAGLGVLLQQRGLLVLHGSGVVVNDSALGFVGAKGWGKSTTAMALYQRGHPLISDELLAIRFDDDVAMIVPGPSPLKIWGDALTSMAIDRQVSTPVRPGVDKFYVEVSNIAGQSRKLDRLYLLDRGDDLGIEPVPLSEAFFSLAPHVYACRFGTRFLQSTSASITFRQLNSLLRSTPVFRLRRERDLAQLEDIAKLIETDVAF